MITVVVRKSLVFCGQLFCSRCKCKQSSPRATWQALRSWPCWLRFTSLSDKIFSSARDTNMLFVVALSVSVCLLLKSGCGSFISCCGAYFLVQAVIVGLSPATVQVSDATWSWPTSPLVVLERQTLLSQHWVAMLMTRHVTCSSAARMAYILNVFYPVKPDGIRLLQTRTGH